MLCTLVRPRFSSFVRLFVVAGDACTLPDHLVFVSFVFVSLGLAEWAPSLNDSDSGLSSLGSDHIYLRQSAGPSVGSVFDGETTPCLLLEGAASCRGSTQVSVRILCSG